MLEQVAAMIVGMLAVLWYLDDTETSLASLKDKRVLVTGASAGIGEQLAYQFAAHGSHVTVTARTRSALERVAQQCSALSPSNQTHHVVVGDMKDLDKTKDVIEEAVNQMGGLDILVLNHILPHPILPFKGDKQDLDLLATLLNVNFGSYVHLTSHALPHLSRSKGRIVVVNSLMGKIGSPFLASYSATKHALDGFFSSLRSQFLQTEQDIGVTACYLGYIGTDSAIKGIQVARQSRIERSHPQPLKTPQGRLSKPRPRVKTSCTTHGLTSGL